MSSINDESSEIDHEVLLAEQATTPDELKSALDELANYQPSQRRVQQVARQFGIAAMPVAPLVDVNAAGSIGTSAAGSAGTGTAAGQIAGLGAKLVPGAIAKTVAGVSLAAGLAGSGYYFMDDRSSAPARDAASPVASATAAARMPVSPTIAPPPPRSQAPATRLPATDHPDVRPAPNRGSAAALAGSPRSRVGARSPTGPEGTPRSGASTTRATQPVNKARKSESSAPAAGERGQQAGSAAKLSELGLLHAAQQAGPNRALELVAAHKARFPSSRWAQERELIAITALARTGRGAQARARALEFRQRFPRSPYDHRMNEHLGEE